MTRFPNDASQGSFIALTRLKCTRLQELQLRIRRSPESRTPRPGHEVGVTLMQWLSEMAPRQRQLTLGVTQTGNALGQTNDRTQTLTSIKRDNFPCRRETRFAKKKKNIIGASFCRHFQIRGNDSEETP